MNAYDQLSKTPSGPPKRPATGGHLQRKLKVGSNNDPLEKEADRVAEQVLAPSPHAAASPAPPQIQRFTGSSPADVATVPASVDRTLASPGRPLEPSLRQDMESRFGHDFSRVLVHSDAAAEQSARDVKAHAYTVGNHIVFGAGRLAPQTSAGKRLLAHELTHVVQQSVATTKTVQREPDGATDIQGKYDVEWKINEGTAQVTYGKKSTTIPLGSRENTARLTRELGITKPQASTVLRDIHANVPHENRLLISFVQNVGNPRGYAIRRFREMRAGDLWHSDALAKPPVEGIRRQIRVSGAGSTALELSEYGYVFFEANKQVFEPKPSGTAQGIQEYQHLNAAKNRTPALTAPVAVVRVNENGKIIEIVEHALAGSPEAVRGKLIREFEKAGWKADFAVPTPGAAGGPPPPRAPIDAHKRPDMRKQPSPMDAHPPPDMGKRPSPMDAHKPPDMGKQPSPMDAHKPPDMTPGGATTVSRFRTAGRFLAREAPGLLLQAILMYFFPPSVHVHNDKYGVLSREKVDPALQDALAKQAPTFNKLVADDPSQSVFAKVTVGLDYGVNASSRGDLHVSLEDIRFLEMKITNEFVLVEGQVFQVDPKVSKKASKQVTYSVPLFGEATSGSDSIRKYREARQSLTNSSDKVRLAAMIVLFKLAKAESFLKHQLVRDLAGMLNDGNETVRKAAKVFLNHL